MKNRKFRYFMYAFYAYGLVAWIVNLVQLLNCDFEEPWRNEIIHGIGLTPGVSMFTCWM